MPIINSINFREILVKNRFVKFDMGFSIYMFCIIMIIPSLFISGSFSALLIGMFLGSFLVSTYDKIETMKTITIPSKESESDKIVIQRNSRDARKVNVGKKGLKQIRDRIDLAIAAGEVLSIKYMGGSNPGERREIVPMKMDDEVILTAICQKSKRSKSFRIDRIVLDDQVEDAA